MEYSREEIHKLFEAKEYRQLYSRCAAAVNEMLLIESAEEFEDFLQQCGELDEEIFWLYASAVSGQSLLIDGYEEDVTERVRVFLRGRLPEREFALIEDDLQELYVDIDNRDTLRAGISACNQHLGTAKYTISLQYEENYCAGVYFLSVEEKQP